LICHNVGFAELLGGILPLSEVNNASLKRLVAVMSVAGLSRR
jgi:hypothetical protein